MAQTAPTLAQEALGAVRGVVALLIGSRRAPGYFDLGQRGLLGALAAFLIVIAVLSFGPMLLGAPSAGAGRTALLFCGLLAPEIGCGLLLLRAVGRSDGFVPFISTTPWTRTIVLLAFIIAVLAGLPPGVALILFGLAMLLLEINIGRLIVTLAPLQVAGLVAAQLVGSLIGFGLIGAFVPLPTNVSMPQL